jgi:nitroreductase
MEFSELIKKRYSVRAYSSKPVEDDKLQRVLEAANLAPTAANKQPFRLIVIRNEGREDELKRIYFREWFWTAPVIICACALPAAAWSRKDGKNYADVDTTIAMDHLILAAADLGLGTCWIAAFDPDEARAVLALPDEVEPVAFTPLGYPADQWKPKKRLTISDLVHYERW